MRSSTPRALAGGQARTRLPIPGSSAMTFSPHLSSAALALALAAAPLLAQNGGASAPATLEPAPPAQGRLVQIRLPLAWSSEAPDGRLATVPLHFERREGRWWALGAIAVDAPDTIPLVLRAAGATDSVVQAVPVRQVDWPTEKLTVAPRYGQEPDSALNARLERESALALEVSRRSHESPRLWRSGFARPRPGRVTSGFGKAREYNGQVRGRHNGTDFAGGIGTPIRATNRGVVAIVDTFYLGGRVVYLDHGAGLTSAYLHLSRADVAVGDTVERGEVIGRVGATGRVTGPHLHWIVRYGGVTVDPLSLPGLAPAPAARKWPGPPPRR